MSDTSPGEITLAMMRAELYSAAVSDALDALGYREQSPRVALAPLCLPPGGVLVGRAKTTRWEEVEGEDPQPYELELRAVDECRADDVFVAAAGGSLRSGLWGELLSTAARNRGCVGAVVDGAVRDVRQMRAMGFPILARGTCVLDSKHRERVVAIDVEVEVGGVCIAPGDLVFADVDGVVVVPKAVEAAAVRGAWEKVHAENAARDAIRRGMGASDAFSRYGVL